MSSMSLLGGPKRPFHEAVKVKPGFHWRPEDIRDTRIVGYLLRKSADWTLICRLLNSVETVVDTEKGSVILMT